jgi:transcriptional regulator with XRE-family HTH domain
MEDAKQDSHLRELRERAGISVRQLARILAIHHTNIVYWEKSGRIAKVELLPKMAEALGVTIEELLGLPKPRRVTVPAGRLGQVFRDVSELPRNQQQRIVEVVEDMIAGQKAKS